MRRPVDRRDGRSWHRPRVLQLLTHHVPDELRDLCAQCLLALEDGQGDVAVRRAAEEEGALKDAVLHERVGSPGLQVGAEVCGYVST